MPMSAARSRQNLDDFDITAQYLPIVFAFVLGLASSC